MLDPELVDYYTRQARDYEKIFQRPDPQRQMEQLKLTAAMRAAMAGRHVLEIACGTAFWTERVVDAVASITAFDSSPGMLATARAKGFWSHTARLVEGDAYDISALPGNFNGAFANFWISHVPLSRLPIFLGQLHRRLEKGSVVFLADNVYVAGLGGELIRRPGEEDTYKRRPWADGTTSDIVKNYFDRPQLEGLFAPAAERLEITVGKCFWWVTYQVASTAPA